MILAIFTSHLSTALLLCLLLLAVGMDLRNYRIPNWLILLVAVSGLGLQSWALGFDGLVTGIQGLVTGLVLFFPLYLFLKMGSGDVKLMAAVGTYLGPVMTLQACVYTLIAGGVLGVLILVVRKGLPAFAQRYVLMAHCLATTGTLSYMPPRSGEAANNRIPYAIAIALGICFLLWQSEMLKPLFLMLIGER